MAPTNLHDRISSALRTGDLRGGGLLSVQPAQPSMRAVPPSHEHRYLTTSATAATLALFKHGQGRAVIRSEILGVSDDWCSWVLSYRVDSTEHRLFVPLVGAEARDLIEGARHGRIGLLFTSSEDEAAHFDVQVPVHDLDAAALLRHWRETLEPSAPDRLLQTMDLLLSIEGNQARSVGRALPNVTVTVVIPEDLQRKLSDLMPEFPFA